MDVKSLLDTSNLRYLEIIYSVQGGLRVRTDVQGNALKYTTKFTRKKYFFKLQVQVLWKWVIDILICITIRSAGLLDIIWDMYCFKGGSDQAGAFAADLPSQTSGCKFKDRHGGQKIWHGLNICLIFYVFDRPAQVIQHDQSYFVSLSRTVLLWISHNVESGHKMKRIHD